MASSVFMLQGVDDSTVYLLAIVCAASALLLIGLTVFRGRPRGRDRCPRCWYSLAADAPPTLPLTCPECGRVITNARQLRRVHWFRWPLIPAFILLTLAPYLAAIPRARTDGWLSFAPNWALRVWIRTMPRESSTSPVNRLLSSFREASDAEKLRIADAVTPLLLRSRPRWPKGMQVAIAQNDALSAIVTLDLRDPLTLWLTTFSTLSKTVVPFTFASAERFWAETEVGLATPVQLEGRTAVPIAVRWPTIISGGTPETSSREVHTVHLPIQLVNSVNDVLIPVQSAEIDALVREHLSPRFFRSRFSDRIGVQFRGWKRHDALANLALGLRIQVLRDNTVIATARWRDDDNAAGMLLPPPAELRGDLTDLDTFVRAQAGDPIWIIRVSADPEMALHDLRRDKYWSGTFDMTLAEFLSPRTRTTEPAPPPAPAETPEP